MAEEKKEEKKKNWWKYAVAAYAAKKAIDYEVDRKVSERLEELEGRRREEEEQRRVQQGIRKLNQTPKGRRLVAKMKGSLKIVGEGSKRAEELEEQKEELPKLVQLYENKVKHRKRVSTLKAVFLDIITLGGAKYIYLKTGIQLEKLKIGKKRKSILTYKDPLLGLWIFKLIWIIILILFAVFGHVIEARDEIPSFLFVLFLPTIFSVIFTGGIAIKLNSNYNNLKANKKELEKARKNLAKIENEYKILEKDVGNAQKFLEDFYNSL